MPPQSATSEPSPDSASFAGMLAALASPKAQPRSWLEDLEDDIATVSYERALQAHARYKPSEPSELDFPALAAGPSIARADAPETAADSQPGSAAPAGAPRAAMEGNEKEELRASVGGAPKPGQSRKYASVTSRMTGAECAQLHQRAAEAGLTVSAYLRSCTFEAESLRAQVKEALAQFRTAEPAPSSRAPARVARWRWLRLFRSHA